MGDATDVERDMVRAAEALEVVLDFLIRYDRAHAVLDGDRDGNGRPLSPLTMRVDDGLRAANRVLLHLRGSDRPTGGAPERGLPELALGRSPVPPPWPAPRQGEPAEVGPRWRAHGDPGE